MLSVIFFILNLNQSTTNEDRTIEIYIYEEQKEIAGGKISHVLQLAQEITMEMNEASLFSGQPSSTTTPSLSQELFYGNRKLNTNGIPKSINDRIMKPMRRDFMYRDHYKRAAPGLFQASKFKNSNLLFILRLHFQLREQAEHMEIFQRLTEEVWEYILYEIRRFSHEINQKWWKTDILYIKKLSAYKNLLYYLRTERVPTKKKLDDFIQSGIYGAAKGKKNSQRAKIDDYAAEYARNNEEDVLELRRNSEEDNMTVRSGLQLNDQDDI